MAGDTRFKQDIPEDQAAGLWENSGVQPAGGPQPHTDTVGQGHKPAKLIIEIASNEDDIRKDQNPHVPYSTEEIAADAIECSKAGAAIIHFHNKDPETGANSFDDPEIYLETARLIRTESDAIFCPSYRFDPAKPLKPQLEYLREYAADPELKPEIIGLVPVHEGGISSHYDPVKKAFYNPKMLSIDFLEVLRELDIKPVFDLYEVGHIREVLAYLDYGLLEEPLATKFFLSDVGLYGVPPTEQGIRALDMMFDSKYDWQVMFSSYGPADSTTRNPAHKLAVELGHHLRLGVGDLVRNGFYIVREIGDNERDITNVGLVEQAVAWGKEAGREIANAEEARKIWGIKPLRG